MSNFFKVASASLLPPIDGTSVFLGDMGYALDAGALWVALKPSAPPGASPAWSFIDVLRGGPGPQGATGMGLAGPQGQIGPPGLMGGIGPQGPQGTGAQGPQGAQGIQGIPGPQGVQGNIGPQGPPGGTSANTTLAATFTMPAVGATNPATVVSAGNFGLGGIIFIQTIGYVAITAINLGTNVLTVRNLGYSQNAAPGSTAPSTTPVSGVGPAGPQGAQGIQGPAGAQGAQGATGAQGPQGVQGPQGIQGKVGLTGPQGATGATGATGAQGVPGPSAVSADPNNAARLGSDSLIWVPAYADGDLVAPASPSTYNDEFTSSTIAGKWTLSGATTGKTIQQQAPTWLQMAINYSYTGVATLAAQETIVSSASFMWQTKVRFLFSPYANDGASTDLFAEVAFLLRSVAANKAIGVYLTAEAYTPSTGLVDYFPLTLSVYSGPSQGTLEADQMFVPTGLDLRLRIGIQGTSLVVQISNDAYNWLTVYSETFSSGPSLNGNLPDTLILQTDNKGSSGGLSNGAQLAAWDYVRMMA